MSQTNPNWADQSTIRRLRIMRYKIGHGTGVYFLTNMLDHFVTAQIVLIVKFNII
jgi:hypothetical protein